MLESQYVKKSSDFDNLDPAWAGAVRVEKNYGMVAPTAYSDPRDSDDGDWKISSAYAQYDNATFRPQIVTAVPLTIPDVYVPDNFDLSSTDCSIRFELSSNTFLYDPDNLGDSVEGGVFRPYLCLWVSATPGGPALGGPSRYKITQPPFSSGLASTFRATMSYDQFVYDQTTSSTAFGGYLGNVGGVRWINYAPIKYQTVQDLNFNIPEAGTLEFYNMLSLKGYRTNEIRIFSSVTSPDCTAQNRVQSRSGVDSSFRSAPDMIPFI